MNILQVEDDKDWFERTVKPLLIGIGANNIYHEQTYDCAIQLLNTHDIDYIVLDLAIPLNLENPVPDVSIGLRLASHVRENYAGTPLLILTGQQTEEAVGQFVDDQELTTFWDGTRKSLIKVKPKRLVSAAIALLSEAARELNAIEAIEISETGCELSAFDKRVIRIFCKAHAAIAAKVKSLNGGLSSAKVLQVELVNTQGSAFPWTSLLKIDEKHKIDIESNNFQSHVNKLPVGSFPNVISEYVAGCAGRKGICYSFAKNYEKNYFSYLLSCEESTLTILERLKDILSHWSQTKITQQVSIRDIRRNICPDHKLENLIEIRKQLGLDEFERKNLSANFCIQHADLHGLNILVSKDLQPILIDYGDIKLAPSVLDVVTLELSQYFHPSLKDIQAPNIELFENWFKNDNFFALSKLPRVAQFLRQWKSENGFLEREYIATVYSYALRQLTYKGTNVQIATKLIETAISSYK